MKDKKNFIENVADQFVEKFRFLCTEEGRSRYIPQPALDVPEMTDENIKDAIREFFAKKTLTEAENHMYDVLKKYIEDTYDQIDWDNGMSREEREEKDPAYIQWGRYGDIKSAWSDTKYDLHLSEKWVDVHGKANTDEEAAKKAADKWCELIFGFHLQDNGALNESHGGGFPACALGTILANKAKEGLTDDIAAKAHDLFYEYYLRSIQYRNKGGQKHIKWLAETLKDETRDNPWDWNRFGFTYDLHCDYGPDVAIYLILYHAGVPERDIRSICPWKTGISIRREDNAVFYNTYQHREEI